MDISKPINNPSFNSNPILSFSPLPLKWAHKGFMANMIPSINKIIGNIRAKDNESAAKSIVLYLPAIIVSTNCMDNIKIWDKIIGVANFKILKYSLRKNLLIINLFAQFIIINYSIFS